MNKNRAQQLYNLADSLSKLDVNTLSEQQLSEREQMIARLQQELEEGRKNKLDAVALTSTTDTGVDKSINTEAYERLYRVFDFSDYKG